MPRSRLLGFMELLFLLFQGISIALSLKAEPNDIPTNCEWGVLSHHIPDHASLFYTPGSCMSYLGKVSAHISLYFDRIIVFVVEICDYFMNLGYLPIICCVVCKCFLQVSGATFYLI